MNDKQRALMRIGDALLIHKELQRKAKRNTSELHYQSGFSEGLIVAMSIVKDEIKEQDHE